MKKTKHIQARMNQRGISNRELDLVREYGSWSGDKCILNRKASFELLRKFDDVRKILIKIAEKGGLVLVEEGESEITCYRLPV
jgi:hypothetical protein